jgi:hypothetical protein
VKNNSWNGRERNLLFVNLGNGKFSDAARAMGCDEVEESRGVAMADLDRDGRLDIVIANNDAKPTIYLNRLPATGNWCRFHLEGLVGRTSPTSNRDGLGTRVTAIVDGPDGTRRILREAIAGGGYAAQSEGGVHFGLGTDGLLVGLEVQWPSGTKVSLDREQLRGVTNNAWNLVERTPGSDGQILAPIESKQQQPSPIEP